jgi:RND family efflux transporter MFP subunit
VPVQIDKVAATVLRDTTEYVATLRSLRSVQVQPQVAGYLTAILVDPGADVDSGKPLMQVDPSRQRALVNSQEASHQASAATLELSRRQLERARRLFTAGAMTRQDLDQAEAQLRQAEATAAASGAQVRAQSVELRYYRVTAPAAGTVGDIVVRVGDYVTPNTLLTTIDDNRVLEAYVDVPLERASALKEGMPLEILDSLGKVLATTEISFISPRATADTQTILARARVPNGIVGLRAGQFTRARVVWSEKPGPAVPVLAIQNRNGQAFAWVVKTAQGGGGSGGQGATGGGALQVEPRVVDVAPIQGQRYPVRRGLAVGETIVVSGVQKLRPGARVMPMPAQAQGQTARTSGQGQPPAQPADGGHSAER